MTAAIFQIVGMLIVAYLLGMLTIWPYLKKKYQKQKENLESELSDKEKQITILEDQIYKNDKKIKDIEGVMSRKEVALQQSEKLLGDTKIKMEKKITIEKKKIKSLTDNLDTKEGEIDQLKLKITDLENKIINQKKKTRDPVKEKKTDTPPPSYYRIIKGIRYKNATLLKAEEAIRGKGDGRISKRDAGLLFKSISDGHLYTDVEKNTIKYLRENFNWTNAADEYFRHKVRIWAAKHHKQEME